MITEYVSDMVADTFSRPEVASAITIVNISIDNDDEAIITPIDLPAIARGQISMTFNATI